MKEGPVVELEVDPQEEEEEEEEEFLLALKLAAVHTIHSKDK